MACDGYAALRLTMKTAANGYFKATCGSLFLNLFGYLLITLAASSNIRSKIAATSLRFMLLPG